MSDLLHFEDLAIGQLWTSQGRTITEADIVNFACTTGDFNPLHVDDHHAQQTIYRGRIAHGLLGISWVAGLASHSPYVKTLAFCAVRDWEFLKPLAIGDTVHVETTVLDKVSSGRKSGKVAWLHRLINQRGDSTQQGVFETMVAYRVAGGGVAEGQRAERSLNSAVNSRRSSEVTADQTTSTETRSLSGIGNR